MTLRTFLGQIAAFLIFSGSFVTFEGFSQRAARRDLDQDGIQAAAQVTQKFVAQDHSKKEPETFWLVLQFPIPGGERVNAHVQVPQSYFQAQAVPASNVNVRYLPSAPEKALIDGVRLPLGSPVVGPVVLLLGLASGGAWLWRKATAKLAI